MDDNKLSISQAVVTNVGNDRIEAYLRKCGIKRSEEDEGKNTKYWVDSEIEKTLYRWNILNNFCLRNCFMERERLLEYST